MMDYVKHSKYKLAYELAECYFKEMNKLSPASVRWSKSKLEMLVNETALLTMEAWERNGLLD